jgi:hypothetical protein
MVSHLHESLLLLFRNRPALAVALIREVLGVDIPAFEEARVVSADLTDIQPAEYRADMVIELFDEGPVFAIILEVQLSDNRRKPFVWPAYVANLRARLECPVCLLVFTVDESVARWAATPVEIGGKNWFKPYVLGPTGFPEVTDDAVARSNPELAVLSAMAHGRDADIEKCVRIAMTAQKAVEGLDDDRARLYFDLTMTFLAEAARNALETMDLRKYEYQSDFARRYVAQGKAEGKLEGRFSLIARQLSTRFGDLSADVESKLLSASVDELGEIGLRLLSARTLQEAMGESEPQTAAAD